MFKEEYKKLNEKIMPGSELLQQTERSMKESMDKKQARRMSGKMAVALALVCALALTGAAFATGAIQSVFGWIRELGYYDSVNMEELNELADSNVGAEEQETVHSGQVSVELNQAYYDGHQLIVGAKYKVGTVEVIHGLEHELMDMTRPESEAFCAVRYEEDNMPLVIDQQGLIPEKSSLIPANITANMTDEQIQAFEKAYAENGEAGVVIYDAGTSDGIRISGDEHDEAYPEDDERHTDVDGTIWRYVDFGTLPESCREQDSLTVTFGIHLSATVLRADKDGVWVAKKRLDRAEFAFEVERNNQETRFAYGSFENEVYSAEVELRLTEISNRMIIDMVRPPEWTRADSVAMSVGEGDVDYIWDYYVIYPDGTHENVMDSSEPTENNGYRMKGQITLQEGQSEVILRPYYTLSGLHEGEDIIIEIPAID